MKQIKVLGVIAIALTLGLTACGKKPECKKHTWGDYVTVTEATCTTDGSQKRTCTVCGKEEPKVIKAGHKYGDWSVDTPSTCETAGSQKRTCSVCGNVDTQPLPLAAHTYPQDEQGNDIVAWNPEATCTTAGVGTKTCSVCGHEETVNQPALDHDFQKDEQGNIIFTWEDGKEPTCTKAGVGTKYCTRCKQNIAATAAESAALDHDLEAIGGETLAPEGEATVRVWRCKRCGEEYLGFKANEVTEESKGHLVFSPETVTGDEEQGARFWGRPIGNAIPLQADGSYVNNTNYACVYCTEETGDFFEYKFTLNDAQAEKLQNCRLYCDAKPAAYLNGQDFWACDPSADEYTSGFYIDGAADHVEKNEDGTDKMVQDHEKSAKQADGSYAEGVAKVDANGEPVMVKQGKRIDDYRYILYVDGEVKAFDSTIKAPVTGGTGNEKRAEYVMPYTFNLHKGTNTISLRMAAGYRSMFYNFIFRPYEAPEVPPVPAHVHDFSSETDVSAKGEGYVGYKTATCSEENAKRINIRALDGTFATGSANKTGNGAPLEGYMKLAGNKQSISYKFDYAGQAATAKLYQYGYMDNFSSNGDRTYTSAQNSANLSDSPTGTNFAVKFNNADVAISDATKATTYTDFFKGATVSPGGSGNSNLAACYIGDVQLQNGDNTFIFTRYESFNLSVSNFYLVIE